MKKVTYRGPRNIGRHRIKFSRHGDLAHGIRARQLFRQIVAWSVNNVRMETWIVEGRRVGHFKVRIGINL